jgi:hypothetical protein
LRRAHLEFTAIYTRTEIGNRLGLQAPDKIFDSGESAGADGGRKDADASLEEAGSRAADTAAAISNNYYSGFLGWNYHQQLMVSHQQELYKAIWQPGTAAYRQVEESSSSMPSRRGQAARQI